MKTPTPTLEHRNTLASDGDAIRKWNVHLVTTLLQTFEGSTNFNADLTIWNVERVTEIQNTFSRTWW